MVDIKARDEFISAAMQMLAMKPDANVMIIVDSGYGLETLQSTTSPIIVFGMLRAAEKLHDESYRARIDAAANAHAEAMAETAMTQAIEAGKKEPN